MENLAAEGMGIEYVQRTPALVRIAVTGPEGETEVDFAVDARLFPVDQGRLTPMLSNEELAVDKVLAVYGRTEARDFLDLAAVEPLFGLRHLMILAKEKDLGFDLRYFNEALARFAVIPRRNFPCDLEAYEKIGRIVDSWIDLIRGIARSRGHGRGD